MDLPSTFYGAVFGLDVHVQFGMHRIIFQQVGHCRRVGKVINGNDLHIRMVHGGPEYHTPDPAKAVDADLYAHRSLLYGYHEQRTINCSENAWWLTVRFNQQNCNSVGLAGKWRTTFITEVGRQLPIIPRHLNVCEPSAHIGSATPFCCL